MSAIGNFSISAVSSVTVLSAMPIDGEAQKLIISGATSLISVAVVELFKYLKERLRLRKIKKSYEPKQ